MKAIITNGMANKNIIDCLITEFGVEIMFDGDDLADKFALSLNLSGIPCVKDGNKVTVSYINYCMYNITPKQVSKLLNTECKQRVLHS